jgi:hypothetical protein
MRFGTGVHNYEKPEEGLPRGTLPAVAELWNRAITGGYYLPEAVANDRSDRDREFPVSGDHRGISSS